MATDVLWHFSWEPFNRAFGPWYRLRALRTDGTSTELTVGGRTCEAVLQPDMDRAHWYWSVRFAKYTPAPAKADKPRKTKPKPALRELKFGTRVDTLEVAKREAIARVLAGRPDVEGTQKVAAVAPPTQPTPKEVE